MAHVVEVDLSLSDPRIEHKRRRGEPTEELDKIQVSLKTYLKSSKIGHELPPLISSQLIEFL